MKKDLIKDLKEIKKLAMWVIRRKSFLGKGNSENEGQCFADGVM